MESSIRQLSEPESRLKDYLIDYSKNLGSSGFFNVYKAKRKADSVKVALKMVKMPYSSMSETDKKSIERDIEVMKKV